MSKICRVVLRMLQKFNYFFVKQSFANKRNILSGMETEMERLSDSFSADLSRGIRINKKFPAGKNLFIDVIGDKLVIEILYKLRRVLDSMDSRGTSGIDIYVLNKDGKYIWKETVAPCNIVQMHARSVIHLGNERNGLRLIMPSFAIIEGIFLSGCPSIKVEADIRSDIVAYGSSITQGCAASRPGLNYLNQISILLGCGILNYGFSESAKGEEKLLNDISLIDSKVIIMEYDHNASVDELDQTHMKAYNVLRKNFKGWIIMLSRFSGELSITGEEEKRRIGIIQKTYDYAKSIGDDRILFYNGSTLFAKNKADFFADKVHPNDAGMTAIASKICTLIQEERMLE